VSVKRRAKAIASLATAMTLTLVLPAQADVGRFTDARNDTSSTVDLWSVRVDNSTSAPNKVIVIVRQDDAQPGDSIMIYLDTRRVDPGPEYMIEGYTGSDAFMYHMKRWNGHGRAVPFRCGWRIRIHERTDITRAVMPRSCLGLPGSVRVAVQVTRGYPVTSRDWTRTPRTWLHSVTR
jgi:hypothetical protein